MGNKKVSINRCKKEWSAEPAARLLRRTLLGPTYPQIQASLKSGFEATINDLLKEPSLSEPLAYLPEETIVAEGETWVNANYPSEKRYKNFHEIARRDSLTAWLIKKISDRHFSVHEKMCLFWQNHFGATACMDSRATYQYHRKIQKYALGNFKELVKEITVDPCMLLFLNGNESSAKHPNENYARELLELFTIGKGPQVAAGDYTNYTEQDIKEGAKILTGWKVEGLLSDKELPYSKFNAENHDQGIKKLSEKFNNTVIENSGDKEYSVYIDIIFKKEATALFICRKLYRWFVNYEITAKVEKKIIRPLAETLRKNNYEIKPVLKQLFMSDHFYDDQFCGSIIKNPVEYMFSFLNPCYTGFDSDVNIGYNMYMFCNNMMHLLGMNYIMPPSVSGWPAYYQEPDYYKLWINASYIKSRFDFAGLFTIKNGIEFDSQFLSLNVLKLIDELSDPKDPDKLIEEIILIFLATKPDAEKTARLKSILLDNLPGYEWTTQYNEYIKNRDDKNYSGPLKKRIEMMLYELFRFPEFQLI